NLSLRSRPETCPRCNNWSDRRPDHSCKARYGVQLDWRAIAGPALAAATTLTAIAIDHHLPGIPNPAALLVCIVAFSGPVSGVRSASVTAGIVVVGAALFFLDHRATPA